ncbi:MAG: hypothetical protein CL868_15625 [Cytophagaceae bacterium]|nr:hypothetical protein [Cytophagaceae bacterium]|tara:strand:+ start:4105 stop:4491 length:387 start_codon:yes stop_codon:yes gene_type:complete
MNTLNIEVTRFLDGLKHPLRDEIELLRHIVIHAVSGLSENIKWNGPNYSLGDADRITLKIHPSKQVQLIFHRGVKKQEQPQHKIIDTDAALLQWKENDRAILSFKNVDEIENARLNIIDIVKKWVEAE